jgi:ribosome biogenesis protein Nip4
MNQRKNFRLINNIEREIIVKSLSKISTKITSFLNKTSYDCFISINYNKSQTIYPSIFLLSENVIHLLNQYRRMINLSSAGLYFGYIKRGNFFLSLEATEFFKNLSCFLPEQSIFLTDKGEKSTLYGNNIEKNMISQISTKLKKKDFLLIFNQKNELIAIAISKVDYDVYQKLNPNDLVALNLTDKGYYLRHKQ